MQYLQNGSVTLEPQQRLHCNHKFIPLQIGYENLQYGDNQYNMKI